jgi:hypothetical protein
MWKIGADSRNYFNRIHWKGGKRLVQVALTTASTQNWIDANSQTHYSYGGPVNEWGPTLSFPCLVPGWNSSEQTEFLKQYLVNGDRSRYPNAFSVWVVPQQDGFPGSGMSRMNWVQYFNARAVTNPEMGFRRFFERDRPMLNRLVGRVYESALGAFRRYQQTLPAFVMRSYRGIRTTAAGATAYGGPATENQHISGYEDWYSGENIVEYQILNDGRIGFRLGPNAREGKYYVFESMNGSPPSGSGPVRGPWSWNGLGYDVNYGNSSRSYEMMFVVTVELDEDLAEQLDIPAHGTGRQINQHGPLLEKMRVSEQEYKIEQAIHSVLPIYNQGPTAAKLTAYPPGSATKDSEERICVNDKSELLARSRMELNRYGAPDQSYELTMDNMYLSMQAGDYHAYIERASARTGEDIDRIYCNAITETVTHDFIANRTTVYLANLR